ncbi:hypothetical protein F5Y00DRAFT_245048 [Daldinia vernicosa]|uniref:uncharacterized protein n=1 Tax=Daldinia vernicosa TaxID=114800 RepID=UPI0020089BA3|nr:uncharacterized protein F5Y00DRAFT_245048 [Daldinia vernicosa]KAI0845979.1 hypothetical protein F5Y00DRAFT_245048 [Daldinia vernicosa]
MGTCKYRPACPWVWYLMVPSAWVAGMQCVSGTSFLSLLIFTSFEVASVVCYVLALGDRLR